MRVWVTRTQPQAEATAMRLRRAGHQPVVQPVLASRSLPDVAIDLSDASAIAFTSQNAVDAFAVLTLRRDLPVFATGEATAGAARAAGFGAVTSADGDVEALAGLILAQRPDGVVVWPGPAEPAGDLAALLQAGGVKARRVLVYETVPVHSAAPTAIDAVLVHSPRAARLLAGMISPQAAEQLELFAISPAAAAPLAALPFVRVSVAPHPDETALLALINA